MKYLIDHSNQIVNLLLFTSEAMAVITQLIAPENKGFSGFLASIIKFLQKVKE
jgi:hypothetical protein